MKTMKTLSLCIMTVAVLLIQLVNPAPVRADDETPPPATAETSTPSPAGPETSDLAPKSPVETSTPVPAPVITLEPASEPSTEAASLPSVLETVQTISENTNVVVLDEAGQPLPLGSQAAAQVLTTSDPVWCPAGQVPTPGANGCTTSYATLSDLVANEGGTIAADGTIWITSGLVPEVGTVTVDGSTYSNWSNYALTLQGGWSGVSGDATIGSNSAFFVPVQIINWNNSIVINNLNIENVVTSDVDWLYVQSNRGAITISNSSISNNTNTSAYTAGIEFDTPGTVSISNSNFDNNTGKYFIYSGNLTINNSNFTNTHNTMAAVEFFTLLDCFPSTVSNVFIGNSNFNNNSGGSGFSVTPLCFRDDGKYTINTIIENSSFNDNMAAGAVLTLGNVEINNSTFNNNSLAGVELKGNGTINNSIFSGNGSGLLLMGNVTLNDVTIVHNEVGLEAGCNSPDIVVMLNHVNFVGNGIDIGSKILDCGSDTMSRIILNGSTFSYQTEGEFTLDCASVDGYSVNLSNGDLVQLFCPVSGTAHISRLDDNALPAPLPAGYSFASAFSLDILQNENPIPVITEGGYLKASFEATSLQAGDTYSILYWDNGTWTPLRELTLDENGREILSDVTLVTSNGSPRVEVSTNFPGIFVLAQH
jgi:hypothetical protein